jgi:hypothetical protein
MNYNQMSLISLNIKEQIIINLVNILNLQDSTWTNLNTDIKLKIIHNLCNSLGKYSDITDITDFLNSTNSKLSIPLKNLRPKKIIQFCGINKQSNTIIFNDYKKKLIQINKDFRNNYNSSNKNYCFGNLSKSSYNDILNNFNYNIYIFLTSNINIINSELFYSNLIGTNHKKVICSNNNLKIKQINYKDKFLNIEFNNNIIFQLELYLTSEKISNNIPAKYKINLINIF